jgi:hypothetical protein
MSRIGYHCGTPVCAPIDLGDKTLESWKRTDGA